MSQHRIPAKAPDIEVMVGWDNPLTTYYPIVSTIPVEADENATILRWLGSRDREFLRFEEMVGPLSAYADLTAEMITTLRADRAAMLDQGPTPLQRLRYKP